MEDKTPQGMIFGSIAYYDNNQLNGLIENMSFEQAYFYLTQAVQHSFNSGVFNLHESEILSKSLRIVSSELSNTK